MDDEDSAGSGGSAERPPLTRRELRERRARQEAQAQAEQAPEPTTEPAAERAPEPIAEAASDEGRVGEQPDPDETQQIPTPSWDEDGSEPEATPAGDEEPTIGQVEQELPSELPPEPDVDDVRWDGPRWPGGSLAESAPPHAAPFPPVGAPPRRSVVPSAPRDPELRDPELRDPEPGDLPARPQPPVPGEDPGDELPTLDDLLATRPRPAAGPAEQGWRAAVRRATGGLVAPGPGRSEQQHRDAVASVQRSLDGPRTIVVINPKGGAHKTTATLLIAAAFGVHRGGYTLAWDNNETRGTLGWRSRQAEHHNTAVNLLQDLDRFNDPAAARVGDLDNYVRPQGSARFDVLASDEDAASAASVDAFAFRALHRTLSRFYRIIVVDTGNNMRASNWQAAVDAADQLVIVSTVREDTAQSAAWAVDALRATGHDDLVRGAVTVLSAPAVRRDSALADRLHEHFGRLTRTVLDVPYDASLVSGAPIDFTSLSPESREAWLRVAAAVAEGL